MTLRLNGSASGYTELEAAPVAGNNKITLPASSGSSGQILKNNNGVLDWSQIRENLDGSISLVAGTAAAPSLSFTGDLNTGIYSPGADQVAISTGGSGRLFVDASGRVGVGSAPSVGNGIHATINTNNYGTALVLQNTNVNGWAAEMQFLGITTTDTQAKIGALATGPGSNSGALAFYTANAGSYLERLRITSAGLVGIGNSSPGSYNASSDDFVVGDHVGAHGVTICSQNNSSGYIMFADGTTGAQTYAGQITYDHTNNRLTLGTNDGTTGLTVDSSQRVGIGTTSPGQTLSLANATAPTLGFLRGSTLDMLLSSEAAGAAIQTYNNTPIQFSVVSGSSGFSERARIDSSGRLLVGASSASTTGTAVFQGNSGGDTSHGIINIGRGVTNPGVNLSLGFTQFQDAAGSVGAQIYAQTDAAWSSGSYAGRLVFSTTANGASSPTPRATIDSSGRLLVGTSSSATTGDGQYALLQIRANTAASTGGGIISLQRGESATSIATDEPIGSIVFADNTGNEFGRITAFADANAGTNDYPGRLVFSTTSDGASSPTERMRIANTGTTNIFASTANVLGASSNLAAGTTYYLFYGSNNASSTTTGTTCFSVYTNGNVQNTNNSYAGISDAKLKENIVDATSQWSDIKALQVRKYNFKEGQTHTQIGLVAQEVELVSPGLVTESPDRDAEGNDLGTVTKSVNYSVLYMKAVKALQEAMERIETLEAENAHQKAALTDILSRISALEGA